MKKNYFFILLLCSAWTVSAQDVIVKKDGTTFSGNIILLQNERFTISLSDGSEVTLPKNLIQSVEFGEFSRKSNVSEMVKKGEKTEPILANEAPKTSAPVKTPVAVPESMSVVATAKGLNASPGIVSQLENRRVVESHEIKTSTYASGRVAVSVCVNTEGVVTSAKFKASGSSTLDSDLISVAVQNAQKFKFTKGTSEDCGVITYDFNL